MKVTAFHMVNKVEEAARSYFSNSLLFSSQTVHAERTADFRRGHASLHFFIDRGDEDERVPMGGFDIEAVQERDNKVAFQCRYTVLPSGHMRQFFLMVTADREPFAQYTRLVDLLRSHWERSMNAYLPIGEDGAPVLPEAPAEDDEYEGLTPEEIEAVTGSRPAPRGARATVPADDEPEQLSAEDIQRLMGMGVDGDEDAGAADAPGIPEEGSLTADEIEALTRQFEAQQSKSGSKGKDARPAKAPPAEPEPAADGAAGELSAEDIWKQITGG